MKVGLKLAKEILAKFANYVGRNEHTDWTKVNEDFGVINRFEVGSLKDVDDLKDR